MSTERDTHTIGNRWIGPLLLLLAACGPPVEATVEPGAPPTAGPPAALSSRGDIAALETLYAATPADSPDRPRLLRRLAEQYVSLETAALHNGDKAPNATADAARQKAITYYTLLAKDYPSWCSDRERGCADEVLFYLAFEHEQAHDLDQARRVYRELLDRWPRSRFAPDASLALAEALFAETASDPRKLVDAERAYQEVLRIAPPDHKALGYAHYKLAYVYLNKGDATQALAEMSRALEVSVKSPKLPASVLLAREARRDLVVMYAAGGDPRQAYDYLAARSGDRPGETESLHTMLEALAKTYADQGKLETAVEVYVDWLDRGAGPKACAVVKQLDAVLARAATSPAPSAKAQRVAAASAALRRARVECAAAP